MRWERLHKIAVCGSRQFGFLDSATAYLDDYVRKNFESTEDVVIITGGSVGVDHAVELWCQRRGIKNLIVYARWTELDKIAGPRRNTHIMSMADEAFAFWDKESPGTRDAIRKAKRYKVPLQIIYRRQLRKINPTVAVIRLPAKTKKTDAKKVREWLASSSFAPKKKKKVRNYFAKET